MLHISGRVNSTFIVKVGDFGLSHDVSETDYYRAQDKNKPLPVKWMAIEVLSETGKYTTKSDVVSRTRYFCACSVFNLKFAC